MTGSSSGFDLDGLDRARTESFDDRFGDVTDSDFDIAYEAPGEGDIRHSWTDIEKAWKDLNFEPPVSVEADIESLVEDAVTIIGRTTRDRPGGTTWLTRVSLIAKRDSRRRSPPELRLRRTVVHRVELLFAAN